MMQCNHGIHMGARDTQRSESEMLTCSLDLKGGEWAAGQELDGYSYKSTDKTKYQP